MMKRTLYLVAMLAILAVIIVPVVMRGNVSRDAAGASPQAATGTVTQTKPVTVQPDENSGADSAANTQPAPANDAKAAAGQQRNTTTKPIGSTGDTPSATVAKPDQGTRQQTGVRVGLAVVGNGGKVLFPPTYVTIKPGNRWGYTALGALASAPGLSFSTLPTWYDWVETIDGESCKGVEGWMFSVDGQVVMQMADKVPVKDGDVVVWWYSQSMNNSPPAWSELMAGRH